MVGRAKIAGKLMQEEPYMKARVVEIWDEEFCDESSISGVKEKSSGVQEFRKSRWPSNWQV